MKKITVIVFLLAAIMVLLTGCGGAFDTQEQDEFVRVFLESAESGNYEDYYDEVIGFGTVVDYIETMKQINEYYNGDIVELKRTGVYVRSQTFNGETTYSKEIEYSIETTQNDYVVTAVFVSEDGEEYKLYYINLIEASELEGNGAIINFKDFDIVQLLLLVWSVICFGFMIFAIVLCAKSKLRLKGLWIPIIVIIQSGFTLSRFPGSFNFNINFFATTISSLRKFINGGTILTVMIPLGAILFVILRKMLIRKAHEYRLRKEMEEQSAASGQIETDEIEISRDEMKDE